MASVPDSPCPNFEGGLLREGQDASGEETTWPSQLRTLVGGGSTCFLIPHPVDGDLQGVRIGATEVPAYLNASSRWSPERAKVEDPGSRDLQKALFTVLGKAGGTSTERAAAVRSFSSAVDRWTALHPRRGGGRAVAAAWLEAIAAGRVLQSVRVSLEASPPGEADARFLVEEWLAGAGEAAGALGLSVAEVVMSWKIRDAATGPVLRAGVTAYPERPGPTAADTGEEVPVNGRLMLIGGMGGDLAGSLYQQEVLRVRAGVPAELDFPALRTMQAQVEKARADGRVSTLRPVGQGGLLAAVASLLTQSEPARGAQLALRSRPPSRRDALIFGEDPRRLLAVVAAEHEESLLAECASAGVPAGVMGTITDGLAISLQIGGFVMAWRVEMLRQLLYAPPAPDVAGPLPIFQHE